MVPEEKWGNYLSNYRMHCLGNMNVCIYKIQCYKVENTVTWNNFNIRFIVLLHLEIIFCLILLGEQYLHFKTSCMCHQILQTNHTYCAWYCLFTAVIILALST